MQPIRLLALLVVESANRRIGSISSIRLIRPIRLFDTRSDSNLTKFNGNRQEHFQRIGCIYSSFPCSLAGQTIFWTDVESDVINRAFWNGSNQQTLVANDLESPAGITFYIYASVFGFFFPFRVGFSSFLLRPLSVPFGDSCQPRAVCLRVSACFSVRFSPFFFLDRCHLVRISHHDVCIAPPCVV